MRAIHIGVLGIAGLVTAVVWPSPGARFAEAQAACVAGASERCEQVARWLDDGEVARQFPEEPGLYFAMACEAGRACARAASWAKIYGDYEVFELDVGCMIKHSGFACEEVATALRDEGNEGNEGNEGSAGNDGSARNAATVTLPIARSRMAHALARYVVACRAGQAEACMGASRVLAAAFGVAWDLREAHAYEAQACALGWSAACEQVAERSAGAEAIAGYRQACEMRSPHACLKLARAEQAARLPATIVAASYRRACTLLAFDACDVLTASIERLDSEPPGVVNGFARWCATGEARACALVNGRAR
jgi:TPR repeat protein